MRLKVLACAAACAGTVAGTLRAQLAPATTFSTSPIAQPTRVAPNRPGLRVGLFGKREPLR
jgi:hypothetical protein